MHGPVASPFVLALFFVVRCMIPLGILLGLSYLFRRLGLIREQPSPPGPDQDIDNDSDHTQEGMAHGNA